MNLKPRINYLIIN